MPASRPAAFAAQTTATTSKSSEKFLVASMVPDSERAASYVARQLQAHLHRRPQFSHPRGSTAFNAKRYAG